MREGSRLLAGITLGMLLAACSTAPKMVQPEYRPAEVRARIIRLLPAQTRDRAAWVADIQAAFAALDIKPNDENLCATLAVTEQESTFSADPVVANLARIARSEIDRRAAEYHIPKSAVSAALRLQSANGKRYDERLAGIHTERELSLIYEELIASVPLGKRLFANANPVRTGGPMQVRIRFAEEHADAHGYPYPV